MKIEKFDHKKVEAKWQKVWKDTKLYRADDKKGRKYYALVELTYTSGDLHMGHWFAWSAPDVFVRMKRMQGENVLFPVGGFDAFGLPAENAAIKHGIHPREWTYKNIKVMRKQFEKLGPSFDWDREVVTSDPDYYKWTQWLFLELFKKGLAYRGKVWSNWCPECKTVLANEHVVNGCCWRHTSTQVEQREVDQWLIRITDYADRLIWDNKNPADWPPAAVEGQNNWIGRKEGITITYKVEGSDYEISCWTSRPETNFGATFVVIAPEHEFTQKILRKEIPIPEKTYKDIESYVKVSKNKVERERLMDVKTKTGVFTGYYVLNQLNGKKLPVWISDFVLVGFGTGAVVGVPGHDKRDFEFADTFGLPIVRVVEGTDGDVSEINLLEQVQEKEGKMVNSEFLNGLDIHKATTKMMDYLEKKGWGKKSVQYHLRDWSVSRRRYWGAPVPIIYCRNCYEKVNDKMKLEEGRDYAILEDMKRYMIYPVREGDLPVTLPERVDYLPTGKAPLATAEDWVKVSCPVCGKEAQREVETLDTYVDSSWYFMRYPCPKYDKAIIDKELIKEWMPVKVYFGGTEHILGHTLYARFITKFLYDQGLINFEEFALTRIHHGVILGSDNYRMSKSRGNVVNPDIQVEKYGADAVRLYICFLGPHDKGGSWKPEGIEGTYRFINRVWRLVNEKYGKNLKDPGQLDEIQIRLQRTIKKVSEDIDILHTHTAIASLMEFLNYIEDIHVEADKSGSGKDINWNSILISFVQLLAPFAPHICEEIWYDIFGYKSSIHKSTWPQYEAKYIVSEQTEIVVQINGKLRSSLILPSDEAINEEIVSTKAARDEKTSKWLKGKKIKKQIFVKGKLINFVI